MLEGKGGQKKVNKLQVFNYQSNEIKTYLVEGEPWWLAKDVCDVLGLTNPTESLKALDEDEKSTLRVSEGGPERNIISESGLYSLIIRSNKPEAKVFKRWITHEVIPSIRKHGIYAKDELLDNPDLLLEVVTRLKVEREKRLEVEAQHKVLVEVVEYKNEVIEGLVDKVDVYRKRTVLNRVVKHKGANFQQRYRELYRVFRETTGVDLQARCEGFNRDQVMVKDRLSVIAYAERFGFIDGLYKVAVRLYETDVNEILKSIQRVSA